MQFTTYLRRKGKAKNPLIHFRGNRFNVIFANGARIYNIHNHIVNFLKEWGTPNRLLKAVLEDASNDNFIAGCKALGLIDKHITGTLWRIFESGVHILDIPEHYTTLKVFLSECTAQNIHAFMSGDKTPFNSELIKHDEIWQTLISESHYDTSVQHILLSLFKSFELLLDRVLADHQPVMIAAAENREVVISQTTSVKPTNTISERDFAQLDRLLREKPNASMIALEAHILFSNNKTSEWLRTKSSEERSVLFEKARKNAPYHRQKYRTLHRLKKNELSAKKRKKKKKRKLR